MGCRILETRDDRAVMYDSVTEWAFGPIFSDTDDHDAEERIELFIKWLPQDPRKYSDNDMREKYLEFCKIEAELWKEEEGEPDIEFERELSKLFPVKDEFNG